MRAVLVLVLMALITMTAPVVGQWVRYPTAGVPRGADGSPDLTAPAPRQPDGKPDLSGTWRPFSDNRCRPGAGRQVRAVCLTDRLTA